MIPKLAKLSLLGSFILQPSHWDAQAEEWSRRLPHDWPGEHGDRLNLAVQSGKAGMIELRRDGQRVAFVVYEIARQFIAPEMILVAAYSAEGRVDVTELCLPELTAFAEREGCATVRFHTMRPGLIAKAMKGGFRVSEVIMRRDTRLSS